MSISSHARRLTATLHLLWFALYVGVPQLVHPCPEHMARQRVAPEQASEVGHAHHGVSSPADDAANEECCCPGPHCGVAAMVASGSRTAVPGTAAATEIRPTGTGLEAAPARNAHTLPFATAPPAQSA